MKREIRNLNLSSLEIRSEEEQKTPKIVGYASVFDAETVIAGLFREVVKPGAFTRAIKEKHDVRALVDHDPSAVLGRTKAGTLKLSEDKTGLKVEITPPDTQVARDLVTNIELGNIDQMSFGFIIRDQTWDESEEEKLPLREIRDVDLFDVSVTTYGQYTDTEVSLRSAQDVLDSLQEIRNEKKEEEATIEENEEPNTAERERLKLRLDLESLE